MRNRFQIALKNYLHFLLLPLTLGLVSFNTSHLSGISLLEETFALNKRIKSISLTMLMKEKINGDYIRRKADFKINYTPHNLYLRQWYPNPGLEILYAEGKNEGKAVINRNTFALSTVRLDPLGNTMRKKHHHSIFKAGVSFMLDIFEHLYSKYDASVWTYNGLVKYADIVCHKITFESPKFDYIPYSTREDESLESLSRKLFISDYMVYEHNPYIDSFETIDSGTTIKVPSDYGKKVILYFDTEQYIPVGVKVFDENGLFEEYTYLNVQINPQYNSVDFDINNPAYGFR